MFCNFSRFVYGDDVNSSVFDNFLVNSHFKAVSESASLSFSYMSKISIVLMVEFCIYVSILASLCLSINNALC